MNEKFAELGSPRRVWAVPAIHSDLTRLTALHDYIATRFQVRDRIVYTGNYVGAEGKDNAAVMDELLAFRAALLAKSGIEPGDIVFLRGPAEEAWQRLLRLQFAPLPHQTLEKLLASGVEAYLRLYNISVQDTRAIARAGSLAITRWTNQLRNLQRSAPGHEKLMCSTRRAAYTRDGIDGRRMLFVPASFDSARSLNDQGESLWWTSVAYGMTGRTQALYSRLVRGFDSVNGGADLDAPAITLDGGCGRGGPLVCGLFGATGKLTELMVVSARGIVETTPYEREFANDIYSGQVIPMISEMPFYDIRQVAGESRAIV